MAVQNVKYNPAFLSQDELVRSFVVRQVDLKILLEVIRENKGETNQHVLIVGPRGSGKTTLVRRAAAEIHLKEKLSSCWYPVIFSEESYEVCSPGEFWLEALFHIGHQTKESRWKGTYEELRSENDEARLRERALSQLMDFADEQGKRLLLIVENLNMLLGQQISHDDAWAIRHTLLNEPRLMLIGTATSRFEQLENSDKAMFELFKIHELDPLDTDECRELWASITGRELGGDRIRPIQILTGGSPRLLVIISAFAAKTSFKELMDDLTHLVDEHTEYFKSHIDSFPSLERKVFVTLADLWQPSTARELAEVARIDVNKASSYLKRLLSKGAVVEVDQGGGKKWYQVAERMYNIYHLMRRRGEPSYRIRGVVHFMVHFYHGEDLVRTTAAIANEACALPPNTRIDHYQLLEEILKAPQTEKYRDKIFRQFPAPFFRLQDLPDALREIKGTERHPPTAEMKQPSREEIETLRPENPEDPDAWVKIARALKGEKERLEDAEMALRRAIDIQPNHVGALKELGFLLATELQRHDEAEEAFRKAIEIDPNDAWSWSFFGDLLRDNLQRYDEAEEAFRKAIEIDPKHMLSWRYLGILLGDNLQRYDEAEEAFRKAIEIDPNDVWSWSLLGDLLGDNLQRYDEAEEAYKRAIEIDPKHMWSWRDLGDLLGHNLQRYDEAEEAYKKAIEIDPNNARLWKRLGNLLRDNVQRYDEAEEAFRKAIEIEPKEAQTWISLGNLLNINLQRYNEAEEAFRKAIEIDPNNERSWKYLGHLLRDNLQRYDEAEEAYKKAIEIDPNDAWAWNGLGNLLKDNLQRYNEAEEAFRKAIEIDPKHTWSWNDLGILLRENLQRYDEAEETFRKAIKIAPKDKWSWYFLGELLRHNIKRDDEAEEAFRKAIEIDPKDEWSLLELGNLLADNSQRYAEAEEAFRKVTEIAPEFAGAWNNLGSVLARVKRYSEAERAYRKGIEIDPYFSMIWSNLIKLHLGPMAAYESAYQSVNQLFEACGRSAENLNNVAWCFFQYAPKDHLNEAETWSREAVQKAPDNPDFQHTLASILGDLEKWDEALEISMRFLESEQFLGMRSSEVTEFFITAAAAGYGEASLDALKQHSNRPMLEPLIVGIKIFLGEKVRTAQEIMEIGKDVAKRIEERMGKSQKDENG